MTLAHVYGKYTQEPFHLHPWDIARLTDWQLVELYDKPADRAYRAAHKMPPPPGDDEPETVPSGREEFIAWWIGLTGGTREQAILKYAEEYPEGPPDGQE